LYWLVEVPQFLRVIKRGIHVKIPFFVFRGVFGHSKRVLGSIL
jgi:hypothetical protein